MSPHTEHFVSGGTGFMGAHFLHDRLGSGSIAALVRATDDAHARARLFESVARASTAWSEPARATAADIRPVVGDISLPQCGIDDTSLAELREGGVGTFWHFAAALNFLDDHAPLIERTNIDGVRHALELAVELGATRFVYVSTAYSAGRTTGVITETLHDADGEFNNPYEASKAESERAVLEFCESHGMHGVVLRPSVLIGHSTTFESGGGSSGMFGLIHDLFILRHAVDVPGFVPRIPGDPEMVVNLNPIDSSLADIRYLIEHDFPGGPIHHLTAQHGVALGRACEIGAEELGYVDIRITEPSEENLARAKRLIGERASFYRSYFTGPKHFERSIPLIHGVAEDDLRQHIAAHVAHLEHEFGIPHTQRRAA